MEVLESGKQACCQDVGNICINILILGSIELPYKLRKTQHLSVRQANVLSSWNTKMDLEGDGQIRLNTVKD